MFDSPTQHSVTDFKEKYTDLICAAQSKTAEECEETLQNIVASVIQNVANESVLEQIVAFVFESASGKNIYFLVVSFSVSRPFKFFYLFLRPVLCRLFARSRGICIASVSAWILINERSGKDMSEPSSCIKNASDLRGLHEEAEGLCQWSNQ